MDTNKKNPSEVDTSSMSVEEYEDYTRSIHPEWFDEDGKRLPTAISGARGPHGVYIPMKTRAERGIKGSPEEQGSNIPVNWKPTLEKPVPVVRCTTTKKDGKQCNRWSIRGITVCAMHGGKRPAMKKKADSVVEAARMRLLGLSDQAVDVLEDLIQVGTNEAIRLKAAQDILDRNGIKGTIDVNVEVEHKTDPALIVSERLKKLSGAKMEPVEDEDDIVDAEVEDE